MTLLPSNSRRNHRRRVAGALLVAVAAGGSVAIWRAAALADIRLWCAVLLVQLLAVAAATGVALLTALPGGKSGHGRSPWGMMRR